MQRQKPVTCLEPVLSVSRAQASISQVRAVASSGIIPACASLSLCCCKKISWLWPGLGLFYPTATGVGSPAAQPVCSPCMHV